MKYLKMIEFLAGELARTEELVKNQKSTENKLNNTIIIICLLLFIIIHIYYYYDYY